jgi:hypothetical protein
MPPQVEGMVRAKMEQKEYIILCLEDSNDWSNATTRRLVMQVGLSLCRASDVTGSQHPQGRTGSLMRTWTKNHWHYFYWAKRSDIAFACCCRLNDSHPALQTDPSLARTVVVSTKLDTRIPQFARGQDVELFLHPPSRQLEPSMLGGSPFFTCAPLLCQSSYFIKIYTNTPD